MRSSSRPLMRSRQRCLASSRQGFANGSGCSVYPPKMVGAPGIEVLDLELSIGDRSGLSNQLISSLTNRSRALLLSRDPISIRKEFRSCSATACRRRRWEVHEGAAGKSELAGPLTESSAVNDFFFK
jgi:hypothetical protein